jgi:hypothetical protein
MSVLEKLEELKNYLAMYCTSVRPHDFYSDVMSRFAEIISDLKEPPAKP